jgi:hypothetical protein
MFIDINKGKKVLMFVASLAMMIASCFGGGGKAKNIKIVIDTENKYIYGPCKSAVDMECFVAECINNSDNIYLDYEGKIGLEEAVLIMINSATRASRIFEKSDEVIDYKKLDEKYKLLVALFAWVGFDQCLAISPTIAFKCLSILNEIAATDYDKALLILKSQCDEDNKPNINADWDMIGSAIHILKNCKNKSADDFLGNLKKIKGNPYEALLGK